MCKRYCLTEATYFSFLIPNIRTQLTDPTTTQIHCAEMPLHFTFQTTTHTVCMKMTWSQCRHKQRQRQTDSVIKQDYVGAVWTVHLTIYKRIKLILHGLIYQTLINVHALHTTCFLDSVPCYSVLRQRHEHVLRVLKPTVNCGFRDTERDRTELSVPLRGVCDQSLSHMVPIRH